MEENKIKQVLELHKLSNLENKYFMEEMTYKLSVYDKNNFINPKRFGILYRKDKDLIYAILDACVEERLLESTINLECCRCGKVVKLNKYLEKNEEYICEECGADNEQINCIIVL